MVSGHVIIVVVTLTVRHECVDKIVAFYNVSNYALIAVTLPNIDTCMINKLWPVLIFLIPHALMGTCYLSSSVI